MKLKEKSFRELRKQYIYLAVPELAAQIVAFFEGAEQATGVLCYCYLEHERGLQLEVLCCARFDAEAHSLRLGNGNQAQSVALPYASVSEVEAAVLPAALPRLAEFKPKVESVQSRSHVTAAVEKTRQLTTLDHLRSAERPDEVAVRLVHGESVEEVTVRLEGVSEMQLYGKLVSEPKSDFGVHAGDSLSFYLVKNAQGIMCLALV